MQYFMYSLQKHKYYSYSHFMDEEAKAQTLRNKTRYSEADCHETMRTQATVVLNMEETKQNEKASKKSSALFDLGKS